MDLSAFSIIPAPYLFIFFLWSLFWKGLSLWKAAKCDQKNWFIALLIINTVGILDILYLFALAKKKMKLSELKLWEVKK